MNRLSILLPLLLILGLAACSLAQGAASPHPGLYVDTTHELGSVSRLALGTNYGPWQHIAGLQQEFLASGITLLRFPGGDWGDQNNIQPGQLDDFISLARQINAEPLISVRLLDGAPDQAAALVAYARSKNYNVHYWSIGNEPSLYAPKRPEWTTDYYNARWREFAQAMKQADPSILLIGPDTNQFTGDLKVDPKDAQGRDWLREFLKANGDLVNVVAVHRYPFPTDPNKRPTVTELLGNTPEWDTLAANLRQVVRDNLKRDMPIAITEFNSSYDATLDGDTGMDTFNNALWLADVLGRLIHQRVGVVAQFALQSEPDVGKYGLLARSEVRPSYYTYQMWKQFGDQLVDTSSDNPLVTIYGARKGDALTLMIINRGDKPQACSVTLDHFAPRGLATARLFDATHNATNQPSFTPSSKFQYSVAGFSVTLLNIPGQVNK